MKLHNIFFLIVFLVSLCRVGVGAETRSDYYCPNGDPLKDLSGGEIPTGIQPENERICLYFRKHESASVLIRKVRQLTLRGGAQSYGDRGKLEEHDSNSILFSHEDPQVMFKMLQALRYSDRYQAPLVSEQIGIRIDAYLLKLDFVEDSEFSLTLLLKGIIPSGVPKGESGRSSRSVPGVSLNFGNLSTNQLKLFLGHARERGNYFDLRSKTIYVTHNEGFHRTFDLERIYIGSKDKYPSEAEEVGLNVMGSARFTNDPEVVQFDSIAVMYAVRSGQEDSEVVRDSPGSRRSPLKYGDPIYLLHKEVHVAEERRGSGIIFYVDGKSQINSVLLITATPISGDSQIYGLHEAPFEAPKSEAHPPKKDEKGTVEFRFPWE